MIHGFEDRKKQFWESYNRLTSLVLKGREVELLLRISVDANTRSKTFLGKSFEDFDNDSNKSLLGHVLGINSKNFGTLIDDTMPNETKNELHSIRDIAGALSHVKINQAKNLINKHIEIYTTKNKPNTNDAPGILVEHIKNEDGTEYGISYHADFSKHNTIMQEWELFELRDYSEICNELFETAKNMVSSQFNNIVLEESMTNVFLALKNGKKFYYAKDGKLVWEKPKDA